VSAEELGPLTERLAALDKPIRNWHAARERAFAAKFTPKRGKLSTLMGRLPPAAAAAAGVAPGPREQVFTLLDEICDLYARSDASRCAVIRGVVHQYEAHRLLDEYLAHAAHMLESGGRPVWLERGVAAASIDDQRRDYRDWLIGLGDLYLAGIKAKLDPAPVFRRIAERSNSEGHRAAPTPTRDVLAHFEQSAYFGTSILPRMG
jgi:hypothetical protein